MTYPQLHPILGEGDKPVGIDWHRLRAEYERNASPEELDVTVESPTRVYRTRQDLLKFARTRTDERMRPLIEDQ